ncbi:unnamed protein product [Rotaria socialis]|uniref:Uncharacterized protein n=1 Tax=Rotaria socialis TaxID=392032 RepID=A0A821DRV8_9BILA|nr:unnamed protein product [Rotaria socialis]CAF3341928.1 unnamed protein product [Rotaria socialis]CAF3347241.1 unnamed protein product [Rotaria socialis]CAF3552823.1 unnamed protein product [Rotaria socialis]CAF3645807.1 unnamed protein product [Rotaria socialis]
MRRQKGSKKDKTKPNKTIQKSLSRSSLSSSSSSFLPSQTALPLLNINYSNDLTNDDLNWIYTPIVNKGGRPKKKDDFNNNIDDNIILTNSPISSPSEINGGRVVVNPAVLRYLEQNRNTNYSSIINKTHNRSDVLFNKDASINMNDERDDHLFDDFFKNFDEQDESIVKSDTCFDPLLSSTIISHRQNISNNEFKELDKFMQDDLFWNFCTYSTDFLTSARLAQWILTPE